MPLIHFSPLLPSMKKPVIWFVRQNKRLVYVWNPAQKCKGLSWFICVQSFVSVRLSNQVFFAKAKSSIFAVWQGYKYTSSRSFILWTHDWDWKAPPEMFDRVLNTTQMGDIFRNEKYSMVHWFNWHWISISYNALSFWLFLRGNVQSCFSINSCKWRCYGFFVVNLKFCDFI